MVSLNLPWLFFFFLLRNNNWNKLYFELLADNNRFQTASDRFGYVTLEKKVLKYLNKFIRRICKALIEFEEVGLKSRAL